MQARGSRNPCNSSIPQGSTAGHCGLRGTGAAEGREGEIPGKLGGFFWMEKKCMEQIDHLKKYMDTENYGMERIYIYIYWDASFS